MGKHTWWSAFGWWCLHLLEPTFWSLCYDLRVPLDMQRASAAHPFFHINVFVLGVHLGRAFVDAVCAPHPITGRMHVVEDHASRYWFLATTSIIAYVTLCCCYEDASWLLRRAMLSIIWALFTLGLAAESYPLARVVKKRPLVWGGTISYEIYVLQGVTWVVLEMCGSGFRKWLVYPFAIHVFAVASHYLLQRPSMGFVQ